MRVIGLTGSIGMGKSFTADIFRSLGVPVHDSDRVVHEIYAGPAASIVAAAFPDALGPGGIDRRKLRDLVLKNPTALKQLEALIHPLVSANRRGFLAKEREKGTPVAVCDVPLLFETGLDREMDVIVVVSAPFQVQKSRVLSRAGMTEERFNAILQAQWPDEEKRRRAHVVIDTSQGPDNARRHIICFLRALV
jgi:dephospho-CoA kinase